MLRNSSQSHQKLEQKQYIIMWMLDVYSHLCCNEVRKSLKKIKHVLKCLTSVHGTHILINNRSK